MAQDLANEEAKKQSHHVPISDVENNYQGLSSLQVHKALDTCRVGTIMFGGHLTFQCWPPYSVSPYTSSHAASFGALHRPVQQFIQTVISRRVSCVPQSHCFILKDKTLSFQLVYTLTLISNF
jgi:hypothetical protein